MPGLPGPYGGDNPIRRGKAQVRQCRHRFGRRRPVTTEIQLTAVAAAVQQVRHQFEHIRIA
jgi:hypothetical protein